MGREADTSVVVTCAGDAARGSPVAGAGVVGGMLFGEWV